MAKTSSNTPPKTPGAIRGTQDIFGPDAEAFAFVTETFERVRKLYRFRRAEVPVSPDAGGARVVGRRRVLGDLEELLDARGPEGLRRGHGREMPRRRPLDPRDA